MVIWGLELLLECCRLLALGLGWLEALPWRSPTLPAQLSRSAFGFGNPVPFRVLVALVRMILDLWAAPPRCCYWESLGFFCSAPPDFGMFPTWSFTRAFSLGAASCEHGNRYDGEGLSFFKNSSGRNSNIWIYNCLNLIDLSLKNVLLRARSWWTGRKRRRPEDEGAPVVHVFQGEGRRRLKRTEDRHRWLYFSCPAHHPFCN